MGQDCKFCGAYIAGSADKCPACGKRINHKETGCAYGSAAAQERSHAEPVNGRSAGEYSYTYKNKAEGGDPRTRYTAAQEEPRRAAPAESDREKQDQLLSFLCYFGPLFLIPYLLRPKSDFIRFHSNQGLVLLIAGVIINVASDFVPFFGWMLALLGGLFTFACFLKGLINVYRYEKKELPLIGSFRILK